MKLARFFALLILRIAIVFGAIGLFVYGLWAFLYWLLM